FGETSLVGALYVVSAVAAGMLSLNAQIFGRGVVATGIAAVGIAVAMLRSHFKRQNLEHAVQEARVTAAELESAQNQQHFHAAFTHATIGMAIVCHEGRVVQANQALGVLLGYAATDLLQRSFATLLHPSDAALLEKPVAGVVSRQSESFSIELRVLDIDGDETWVSLHCGLFDDPASAGAGLIFQLHDITSRRRAEGDLQHIAYHDSVTDLANRNCFNERLAAAVEVSRDDSRAGFAVMYLDLDRFKIVNDSLGHPAGDQLLKDVAGRLRRCVRPAASIGITFSDMGYREPGEVLRDADMAMYKAKADGKGRFALFDSSLTEQLGYRLQLESDLRRAIEDGGLSLAYQPLFNLEPHRLDGFEALARWTHPVRGFISPAVFIALAEETGCIEALTRWAIDEAVRQHVEWRGSRPELDDAVMHVNVSGADLAKSGFVSYVRGVLAERGLPPRLLTLEITESTLMEHRESALRALVELSELGVKIGIDDFGTGYSSLAYLSTLPFDCLKIDRSFVIGMDISDDNIEIVRTVISLARSLKKSVVAEGIERVEQLRRLKGLGAAVGQGYLLSRPLSPQQVLKLLQEPATAPA
ncbi:MAG: EAL domain-containing protein, partial [Burkholderiaceae bacterium]